MLLFALACAARTATPDPVADDFFPLIDGARYDYAATFNGREMTETRVVVPLALADGSTAYGFLESTDLPDGGGILFSGHIGLGLYRNTGAAVETLPAFWRSDVPDANPAGWQTLVALPPVEGAAVALDTDSPDRSGMITVVAREPRTVPAGTFQDCVHLDLGQNGSSAWLCAGVGLVEWTFVTGRHEVLTAYSF